MIIPISLLLILLGNKVTGIGKKELALLVDFVVMSVGYTRPVYPFFFCLVSFTVQFHFRVKIFNIWSINLEFCIIRSCFFSFCLGLRVLTDSLPGPNRNNFFTPGVVPRSVSLSCFSSNIEMLEP